MKIKLLNTKLTNIIKNSNNKNIEQSLNSFFDKQDCSIEFLQDYLFKDANDLKLDLFSKYEKFLVAYTITVKKLINSVMDDFDNNKDILLYPILFNMHHAVELFYKTYKIFYYILFGSYLNPINAIVPPFIKDLKIDDHNIETLFNDEEIIFACETLYIKKKDLKQIGIIYKEIMHITELNNLFEQTRFPQDKNKCYSNDLKTYEVIDYFKIYLLVDKIDNLLIKCLESRYSKDKISKSIMNKIDKKSKQLKDCNSN